MLKVNIISSALTKISKIVICQYHGSHVFWSKAVCPTDIWSTVYHSRLVNHSTAVSTRHRVGQMSVGHMPVGQISVSQMPVSQMYVSQMPVSQMLVSQMLVGQMSVSQVSQVRPLKY
jgi:hypothetical protein